MSSPVSAIGQLSGLFNTTTAPGSGGMASMPSGSSSTLSPNMFVQGSNQYGSYPTTQASSPNIPGTALPSSGLSTTLPAGTGTTNTGLGSTANTGAYYATGGDVPGTNSQHIAPTEDPSLTNQYFNMLSGQVGEGLPAFDLSAVLPSSGQTTAPGTLTAPLNSTLQQIQSLLAGGSTNIPGGTQLQQLAATGDPINQTPAWQAMIASEQQNTAQGANNLREQFAGLGALDSSSMGTAMQQYYNQAAENQNAQLTGATATAQQQAVQNMLTADTGLQTEAQSFGSGAQTLDQSAITNLLNQFNQDLPQNNPLLSAEASAAQTQVGEAATPTTTQNIASILQGIGSILPAIL